MCYYYVTQIKEYAIRSQHNSNCNISQLITKPIKSTEHEKQNKIKFLGVTHEVRSDSWLKFGMQCYACNTNIIKKQKTNNKRCIWINLTYHNPCVPRSTHASRTLILFLHFASNKHLPSARNSHSVTLTNNAISFGYGRYPLSLFVGLRPI